MKRLYNGNSLRKVTDKGESCTATGATDFHDGADIAVEYTYDACGARTSDANKGIASIKYSYWGTPELIQFTNGCQTRYVYNADGVKLKRIHITAVDNIVVPLKTVMELSGDQILTSDTTEYCGNFIFENGKLDKVLFSSGYVSCNSGNEQEYFTFHYYVKDHLGNNRAVISEDGHIEQTTHYYPFGNSFADAGTNSALQHYKYNGKELDRMHGLDWYDYGARNYDPVILLWDRIDPLADKYHPVSPYVYCMDNPVKLIDTDGRKVKVSGTRELNMIKHTLPKESWKFVQLDRQGFIDQARLGEYGGTSGNYASLQSLVNSSTIVEVSFDDGYRFMDDTGNYGYSKMHYIPATPGDDTFVDLAGETMTGTTTGENGFLGKTLFPDRMGKENSTNASIQIIINKNLSESGAAETYSHEANGHALLYLLNGGNHKGASHQTSQSGGLKELNAKLKTMIIQSKKRNNKKYIRAMGRMKLWMLFFCCSIQLSTFCQVRIDTTIVTYYDYEWDREYTELNYKMKNQSKEDYVTWISRDDISDRNPTNLAREFFLRIRDDFSFIQLYNEDLLNTSVIQIGSTFIKLIKPHEIFSYSFVTQNNEGRHPMSDRVVVISRNEVQKALAGLELEDKMFTNVDHIVIPPAKPNLP